MPQEFSKDWFSEAIPVFNKYLAHFKKKDSIRALEIGSYEGRSAVWLLDNILTGNNCSITCIDNFTGSRKEKELDIEQSSVYKRFLSNMEKHNGRYGLLVSQSNLALESLLPGNGGKYHIAYIDGSHRADDTLLDLVLSFELLANNGVMLIDDYLWNYNVYPENETPKLAIDSFMSIYRDKAITLHIDTKTVVLQKVTKNTPKN